jgi:hypothetical protein
VFDSVVQQRARVSTINIRIGLASKRGRIPRTFFWSKNSVVDGAFDLPYAKGGPTRGRPAFGFSDQWLFRMHGRKRCTA